MVMAWLVVRDGPLDVKVIATYLATWGISVAHSDIDEDNNQQC